VLSSGPTTLVNNTFTPNAIDCLKTSLSDDNRYLKRNAQKVVQMLHLRIDQEPTLAAAFVRKIVALPSFVLFDSISKTKTI
jgi:hypothetical protein